MNPIIYFDELDKISQTPRGKELFDILIHLTDPSQNTQFHDEFLGIDIDLSKALLVFSYNDPDYISDILLDRIKNIEFHTFNHQDKVKIIQQYTLPRVIDESGFKLNQLKISNDVINYINRKYTDTSNGGVRNLI